MTINILGEKVISQIAAGEVVERPASVVKELIENSLDATASQITVEVRGGGTGLIRVSDDGAGIPAGELATAFKRHATSKINNFSDLETINSLGFRGEALPSIAAVAEVEMISRTASEAAGNRILLKGGDIAEQGSQGHPPGTTVAVHHLLENLPARLKFLKTPATENGHIAGVASQYALARPEIRFTLSIDGRVTLRTPGSGSLLDSLAEVHGPDIARNMLAIDSEQDNYDANSNAVSVNGLVGTPSLSRSNRGYLSFFVNRRWIQSRLLSWAVEEAYHGLLMRDKHPVAVINISMPPGELDVNIHPTKTEVKFRNERLVFAAVQKTVRSTLLGQAPVQQVSEAGVHYSAQSIPRRPAPTLFPKTNKASTSIHVSPEPASALTPGSSLPALRPLGQIAASYIVAEGPEGLYLIDQHAAHERIRFEKILSEMSSRKVEVQGLLEPAILDTTPHQQEVLAERREELEAFGFSLEPFGERSYLVRAVPALLSNQDWQAALREILDAEIPRDRSSRLEGMAASIACHGAVLAGKPLSAEEIRTLLGDLEKTETPNTCPHGRPTMIQLGLVQLERMFGRS